MSHPAFTAAAPLDRQRQDVLGALDRAFDEDFGETSEGLLEAVVHALLYVGDCIRDGGAR